MGPGNHVLDGGQDRMNPFTAMWWQGIDTACCQTTLDTASI